MRKNAMKQILILLSMILAFVASAYADFTADKALWESNMLTYGHNNCNFISSDIQDDAHQLALYYDGMRVFANICDYTGDPQWCTCAWPHSRYAYRDFYVIPNNGAVPGYENFAYGLRLDWQRNGDATSRNAVSLLKNNGAWCPQTAYNDANLPDPNQQRENAYCGDATLDYYLAGFGLDPRITTTFLANALSQLNAQFGPSPTALYRKPFMVSLAVEFLTRYYYEINPDTRIVPAVKTAAQTLWTGNGPIEAFWVPTARAMLYVDTPQPGDDPAVPAPDLNLLIAPVYYFLYHETGDTSWRDKGDALFNGGVNLAFLGNGKQFNQNYRWSFQGVTWREAPPVVPTSTPTPGPSPTPTPTPTRTPTNTPTRTPTFTPTATFTPTITFTPSVGPSPTITPTFTASNTPTITPTFTPSRTRTPTFTPTITNTPTVTNTPTSTPTRTNTPTPVNTATPTNTRIPTVTRTPTRTPISPPSSTPTCPPYCCKHHC